MSTEDHKISDGDVVRLRSGGPEMVVEQALNGNCSRLRYYCDAVGVKQLFVRNCCLEFVR